MTKINAANSSHGMDFLMFILIYPCSIIESYHTLRLGANGLGGLVGVR
jgi:hypothetical protein